MTLDNLRQANNIVNDVLVGWMESRTINKEADEFIEYIIGQLQFARTQTLLEAAKSGSVFANVQLKKMGMVN